MDILKLAKEAGTYTDSDEDDQWLVMPESCFERFAELISNHVREECAKIADAIKRNDPTYKDYPDVGSAIRNEA